MSKQTYTDPLCACANCEWSGPLDALKPIKHYWSRVDEEDDVEPDGECPSCGCLAYQENEQYEEKQT